MEVNDLISSWILGVSGNPILFLTRQCVSCSSLHVAPCVLQCRMCITAGCSPLCLQPTFQGPQEPVWNVQASWLWQGVWHLWAAAEAVLWVGWVSLCGSGWPWNDFLSFKISFLTLRKIVVSIKAVLNTSFYLKKYSDLINDITWL